MCFSATGSLIAAAINGAAGIAALRKTSGTKESMLGTFPLVFAAQQTIEGILWLELPAHTAPLAMATLANTFVLLALVVWPVLAPLATVILEKNRFHRALLMALLGLGLVFSIHILLQIRAHPYAAQILGRSISYSNGEAFSLTVSLLYCVCTCAPLLVSTQGTLKLLGLCVLVGLIVSYGFFFYTFLSVWCFFAAIASGLIFFRAYFELPEARRAAI